MLEVTYAPSQKDTSHRQTVPVFGYVLEGESDHAINDEPISPKMLDTFFEPTVTLNPRYQGPDNTGRTQQLGWQRIADRQRSE